MRLNKYMQLPPIEKTTPGNSLISVKSNKQGHDDQKLSWTIISTLFEELPVAVVLYKKDGGIYYCNKDACRMFGYSRTKMQTLHHTDLLPENFQNVMPGKIFFEVTTNGEFLWVCRRHSNGSIFQCEYSSKIIKLEEKEFYLSCYRQAESGGMLIPDTMTERILAESPRVNDPISIYTWQEIDGELRLIGYNPVTEELTNGKVRQYLGCNVHEVYENRGRSDVVEGMYRVYKQKGIFKTEAFCDYMTPGIERFVDSVTFFMAPNLLIQFIEDITDRRHALNALKESEERFKALYLGSPVPVATWRKTNKDFVLLGHNYALEEFTRDRISEFVGSTAEMIFHSQPELCEDLKICYEKKSVVQRETWCRFLTDKNEKCLVFTNAFVPSDLVLTYIHDATERKRNEAELLRYQQELSNLYEKHLDVLEHERQRISQELHDGLGQYLSTIKVSTENMLLSKTSEMDHRSLKEQLQGNVALLKQAILDVSKISMDLRPSILDDLGIIATINWFLREFGKVYKNIHIEKQVLLKEDEVPQNIKIVVYRILQEAMNNIAKHSNAERISIRMKRTRDDLEFVIQDNGRGFDVQSLQKSRCGLGIAGMRERVAFSQGRFSIDSIAGGGTTVRALWMLNDRSFRAR